MTSPILALPDFSKIFVGEYDASENGLGPILMQELRPLAYLSQALKGKILFLSTYEKEFLALVLAVQKWRHYLLGAQIQSKDKPTIFEAPFREKDWDTLSTKVDNKAVRL